MSVPVSGVGVRHWWGDRLLALLDDTGAAAARAVQRGRALARRGAVEEVTLRPGRVTGTVLEDRAAPIEVEIGWPVTDEAGWERAAERLGRRLRPIAALLEGGLTPVLVEELAAAGIELLPDVAALAPRCGCGASPSWCRHAAALHTVVATRLDRDPMLLLELGGRTRDQLLAALRGVVPAAAVSAEHRPGPVAGDLDDLEVHPRPVPHPAHLLHQLGPPPGVEDPAPLEALVTRAAATAWQLAAGDGAEAADEAALLSELRAQRVATVASLAQVLGWDPEVVDRGLEALFERGEVLRTGSGERTRYRASSG
ncbi:MAG: hypothetical protein ACLFS9_01820 [Nitriliruptoraceae bacterium]